jgi:hypothetical protein
MEQNYLLELHGRAAGRFFAFTGGGPTAAVLEKPAPGTIARKHILSRGYQDMVLTCGTGMSRGFYDWIGSSFGGASDRKDGAVVVLDNKQKPTARLQFGQALVTSLVLPELDRSTGEAAYMTVGVSPEFTRSTAAEAGAELGVYISALPRAWNISDFRLWIDGLEADCAHVTHIGSLSLREKTVYDPSGESRELRQAPTGREYSNLVFRLPNMFADGFYKWFDDFVVKGNNSERNEKNGTLEFFAPNSNTAYFGLKFSGLGIFKFGFGSGLRTKTNLPVTVEMYCENMKFYAGAAAVR